MNFRHEHYALLIIYGFLGLLVLSILKNHFDVKDYPSWLDAPIGVFILPAVAIILTILLVPFIAQIYHRLKNSIQVSLVMPLDQKGTQYFFIWTFLVSFSIGSILYTDPSILLGNILPKKISEQITNYGYDFSQGGFPLYLKQFGTSLIPTLLLSIYRLTHIDKTKKIKPLLETKEKNIDKINEILNVSNNFTNFLITIIAAGIIVYVYGVYSSPVTDMDVIQRFLLLTVWIFSFIQSVVIVTIMKIVDKYF